MKRVAAGTAIVVVLFLAITSHYPQPDAIPELYEESLPVSPVAAEGTQAGRSSSDAVDDAPHELQRVFLADASLGNAREAVQEGVGEPPQEHRGGVDTADVKLKQIAHSTGMPRAALGRNFISVSTVSEWAAALPTRGTSDTTPPWVFGASNLPGTAAAQFAIWRHQHPPVCDCETQAFFVWRMMNQGLGSELHTLGWALAQAMEQGRILLVSNREEWLWTRAPAASPSARRTRKFDTQDVFFGPLTNCTCSVSSLKQKSQISTSRYTRAKQLPTKRDLVPTQFAGRDLSWWRAQATRYFVRNLQTPFRAAVEESVLNITNTTDGKLHNPCISMHVRRSDKVLCNSTAACRIKEMDRVEFGEYMKAALELKKSTSASTIFLTTESHEVAREAAVYSAQHPIGTPGAFHFVMPPDDRHDWDHRMTIEAIGGPGLVSLSLANLAVHTQCVAFVGTRRSNWCRVIDELRKTSGQNSAPFVDLTRAFED